MVKSILLHTDDLVHTTLSRFAKIEGRFKDLFLLNKWLSLHDLCIQGFLGDFSSKGGWRLNLHVRSLVLLKREDIRSLFTFSFRKLSLSNFYCCLNFAAFYNS